MIFSLEKQLRASGITLVFSGLKLQVMEVMERTGLIKTIGEQNIYGTDRIAFEALQARVI